MRRLLLAFLQLCTAALRQPLLSNGIGRRAALALPLAPTAAAAATRADATTVSYGPRDADLYLQPGRRPVVALLHDSLTASRDSLDAVARDVVARTACHCVNFDYRGADDVETAMAWLTSPAAAALGLENNVVLIGHDEARGQRRRDHRVVQAVD